MNSYAKYEVPDTSVSLQQSLRIHLCGHLWQVGRLTQKLVSIFFFLMALKWYRRIALCKDASRETTPLA